MPPSTACVHSLVSDKSALKVTSRTTVSPANRYVLRTHTCGELTLSNVGEEVKLSGWLEFQRMHKFLTLRDSYGSTQLLIPENVSGHKRFMLKLVTVSAVYKISQGPMISEERSDRDCAESVLRKCPEHSG